MAVLVVPANYHDPLVTTEHENTPCRTFSEPSLSVIPAEAGIQKSWIPVFTGMTELAALGKHPPGYFQVKAGTQPLPDSGPCLRRGELVNCRMAWIRIPTLLSPSGNGRKALAFRRRLQ